MTMITASTALTIIIMNIHHCGSEAKPVPQWARVVILDYMSKILFVYDVGENCTGPQKRRDCEGMQKDEWYKPYEKSTKAHEAYVGVRKQVTKNEDCVCDIVNQKEQNGHIDGNLSGLCVGPEKVNTYCCTHYDILAGNIEYITNCFKEQRASTIKGIEWKKVAKVMDRFFMWVFFLMVFFMSLLIIGKAA